jgi:hypothetical protein
MAYFAFNDPDNQDKLREFMGPGMADHMIRQTLRLVWMTLPAEKKTVEELERVVRRLLDRALEDLREDQDLFGSNG